MKTWQKSSNFLIELLIGCQLLFLNNFCEPLCKKSKQILSTIFDMLRFDGTSIMVGDRIDGESYELLNKNDGLTEQILLNVTLLVSAISYNFNQMLVEQFNEQPKHFATFCHLIEQAMPSSLNALESDGTVPCRSSYETKLLVCGLARVFYG